jgi:hypothetical protein
MLLRTRTAAITILVAVVSLMASGNAYATTIRIGDVDGFGIATIGLVRATGSPHTSPADTNGDGNLTEGEYLPDWNKNGTVGISAGDEFDQRSAPELLAVDGSQWTDRSVTGFGAADGVTFTFMFSAPSLGDFDFEVDHTFNLMIGDYDVFPVLIQLDGVTIALTLQGGSQDGLIQLVTASVPFSLLTDGQLVARITAPSESYLAFDYAELVGPVAPTSVPEPTSITLVLLGIAGLLLRSRHQGAKIRDLAKA